MHDANGKPLSKGDKVLVPAVIADLGPGEDYCNAAIVTALGGRPYGHKHGIQAINTGMLVKVSSEDMPQDCMTDEELRREAKDHGVDLTGVKDRAGIIEAIRLSAEH